VDVFTRGPLGRHTYLVTFGPDGVMRGMDQVLTYANADKVIPGTTTRAQVRELLGPPSDISRLPRQEREVWEYKWLHYQERRVLWVQFSDDGIVRESMNLHDFAADPVSGRGRRK
jgi:outer membrane protein assembly factor BamE (lipoprotein component of BamABCDE complex)